MASCCTENEIKILGFLLLPTADLSVRPYLNCPLLPRHARVTPASNITRLFSPLVLVFPIAYIAIPSALHMAGSFLSNSHSNVTS